jgi:hypothetical protein
MTNELKGNGLRRIGLSLFPAYPPVIGLELNNHQLKLVGLIYGLEVRIRVA